jgi:hypothetical protein
LRDSGIPDSKFQIPDGGSSEDSFVFSVSPTFDWSAECVDLPERDFTTDFTGGHG